MLYIYLSVFYLVTSINVYLLVSKMYGVYYILVYKSVQKAYYAYNLIDAAVQTELICFDEDIILNKIHGIDDLIFYRCSIYLKYCLYQV